MCTEVGNLSLSKLRQLTVEELVAVVWELQQENKVAATHLHNTVALLQSTVKTIPSGYPDCSLEESGVNPITFYNDFSGKVAAAQDPCDVQQILPMF